MEKNYEKQERYRELKAKLKKAMADEFWLEACMIEYAIIEDRTSSILFYSGVSKNAYDSNKKLSNKLNSIELQIGKKHPVISKKVAPEIIQAIRDWKELRNQFVHKSCAMYDEEKAKVLAVKGKELVDLIANDSDKVRRLAEKLGVLE